MSCNVLSAMLNLSVTFLLGYVNVVTEQTPALEALRLCTTCI